MMIRRKRCISRSIQNGGRDIMFFSFGLWIRLKRLTHDESHRKHQQEGQLHASPPCISCEECRWRTSLRGSYRSCTSSCGSCRRRCGWNSCRRSGSRSWVGINISWVWRCYCSVCTTRYCADPGLIISNTSVNTRVSCPSASISITSQSDQHPLIASGVHHQGTAWITLTRVYTNTISARLGTHEDRG